MDVRGVLAAIEEEIKLETFPGCEFAVIDGENVRQFCLGEAAIKPEREVLRPGCLWDLASVSKVVGVGTYLINQVIVGDLVLDTPLKALYSDWREETVTIRQLLTHTSGIDPFIPEREKLGFDGLITAMNHLSVKSDKRFHYTDVNFILLGLMIEQQTGRNLSDVLQDAVFNRWNMQQTSFGPVVHAVPTDWRLAPGSVHDPKARVLGIHCGSAGLFSTLSDLTGFVEGYFATESYLALLKDWSANGERRSLAWALRKDGWLVHTGYTGTFILMNLRRQQAFIFLSNRVHLRDERAQWILRRDALIEKMITSA
jgi:CubicO group peptidase (beta-lactamase class C family)